jgi:putative ABC transport system permease protein
MNLRRRAGIRHLFHHPWQLGLSLLGVALGVAVMVATGLAVESSREALRVSVETVSGRATHRVVGGPAGVPDSLAARLVIEAGMRTLAPAIEGYVVSPVDPSRPLRLLGVDPFSDAPFRPWLAGGPGGGGVDGARLVTTPGGAILGAETAGALGVEEGGSLDVLGGARTATIRIVGVLEAEDRWSRSGLLDLAVVDIAEAQEILGREGVVDRLDLILPPGAEGAELLERIGSLLPPGVSVEAVGAEAVAMQDMLRAFDLNLRALSLLALVFGIFLIYNAMTFSVVQRRGMLGTLRALGTTRGELVRGILTEGAVVGFVGSVLGLLAGVVLGRGLVQLVTRTINDLYFVVAVEGVTLAPGFLVRSLLLGTGATLLAALLPAWEAGAASPREAMARSSVEDRVRTLVPRAAVAGVLMLGVGTLLLALPTPGIVLAFGGLFALILGMALLVPATTVFLIRLVRPVARGVAGVIGAMAARGVVTSLSRTAPALAALVVAVSVTIALGVMIQSFRGSVVGWLDTTLVADVHVTGPSVVAARPDGEIPRQLAGAARALPGVVGVSSYRSVALQRGGELTRLLAVELDPRGEAGFEFLSGGEAPAALFDAFRGGEGFLVSEPFAFHRGLEVGDALVLDGEAGAP